MPMKPEEPPSVIYDKTELRDRLTPMEYQITQERGTERPYSNKYYKYNVKGRYLCKICSVFIFDSSTKYDSGSGWPSFYDVVNKSLLRERHDSSGIGGNLLLIVSKPNLIRTEVSCKNCGSHLGHVFKDGPKPTGLRYCVNSASLEFVPDEDEVDSTNSQPLMSHPATLGGCGGSSGVCAWRPPSKERSPAKSKEPSPVKSKEPSPVKSKEASPVKVKESSPVKAKEASPVKQLSSASSSKPLSSLVHKSQEDNKEWSPPPSTSSSSTARDAFFSNELSSIRSNNHEERINRSNSREKTTSPFAKWGSVSKESSPFVNRVSRESSPFITNEAKTQSVQ